ncbi:hypothetical protein AB0451_37715 [Streptomyces sp. NPDC052000]|uniref:hypothetical protein n=1 Tax=Streptomyces sp. NPDC052000 TaxID=3155676 RepID=UPI00344C90EB
MSSQVKALKVVRGAGRDILDHRITLTLRGFHTPLASDCGTLHVTIGSMENRQLPEGWTLQQVRDVSGDERAEVLSPDRSVVYCGVVSAADEALYPTLVLGFGVLCIVKVANDNDWYMGSLNDDGSVICWSIYDDLHEALRGL